MLISTSPELSFVVTLVEKLLTIWIIKLIIIAIIITTII